MAAYASNERMLGFVNRFEELKSMRSTSDQLIEDILRYCQGTEQALLQENATLVSKLKELQLDIDDATRSRRDFQTRMMTAEARSQQLELENTNVKNRNPYVLVLIDGDGLIFQQDLIRQGIEGGKKAAYALRLAVSRYIGDTTDEVEICAKVIANLSGLGRAMRRDGCIDSESELKEFSLGFTQAKASFDFIDVGHGKERADSKIKELTRWNLRNYSCHEILLGISHDAGYAPFLDEILRDESTRRRITVLEGVPCAKELLKTSVNITNVSGDLFRSEKLLDRTSAPAATPVSTVTTVTMNVNGRRTPPIHSSASYSGTATTASGGASPPPQLKLPLSLPKANGNHKNKRSQAPPRPELPPWNPGPRGLDPPIPINQMALDAIKKRKDSHKLCNNHYLRGPCSKGDSCCFEHYYRPNPDERNAIAFLARLNPCTSGQDCEIDDCIYGHHCPSIKEGLCTHPYCKFTVDEHPPGTKFKNPRIHDN